MKLIKKTGLILLIMIFIFGAVSCSYNTGKNIGGCENGIISKSKSTDSTKVKIGI